MGLPDQFHRGMGNQAPKTRKAIPTLRGRATSREGDLGRTPGAGMISPSRSPVAAPTFFVPKKDGSRRYVVDWRGINAITVKDAYPLPLLDDLLDMAQGATLMSKFDLMASYNQIPIRQQDRWKTAFITSRGTIRVQRNAFWV
jgi:hypothetical protein